MFLDRIRHNIRTFVAPFLAYHLLFGIVTAFWVVTLKAATWIVGGNLNSDADWALTNAFAVTIAVYMVMMVFDILWPRPQEAPLMQRPFEWAYRRLRLGAHVAQGTIILALAASLLRESHYLVSIALILAFVVQWAVRGNLRVFYRM